jgi:hypothetical protein
MTEQVLPYIQRKPGDPITSEDWNEMQIAIKGDIGERIASAIEDIDEVAQAGDAEKLGGKTPDQYAQDIIDRVLKELPKRTGYQPIFKNLKQNKENLVEHKLGAMPLVDAYQLDYFYVVASEDSHVFDTLTHFYLYHSSESKIRFRRETTPDDPIKSVTIDPPEGHAFRIPLETMLKLYKVEYTDESSLGDLETEFWKKFFSAPNDRFDDDQHYHSPWFDRACREQQTVKQLKSRREWDDLHFQVRPRKIIYGDHVPSHLKVVHFNLDTLGLTLSAGLFGANNQTGKAELLFPSSSNPLADIPEDLKPQILGDRLSLMLLLKV